METKKNPALAEVPWLQEMVDLIKTGWRLKKHHPSLMELIKAPKRQRTRTAAPMPALVSGDGNGETATPPKRRRRRKKTAAEIPTHRVRVGERVVPMEPDEC